MPTPIKRSELDRLAAAWKLNTAGVTALLDVAGARPSRAETRQFLAQVLFIGGVLSLAASVVFFIAANWSRFAVLGRFGLLEALLVAAVVLAWLKPPPHAAGRAALFLAFIVTGALLALFGQTYQTGADVYELFLTWSVLGLVFAVAAQWSVASAAWVLVLNAALLLFCGWQPRGGVLWLLFGGLHVPPARLILGAALVDFALWFGFELRSVACVPHWVRRLIVTLAFLLTCWAGFMATLGTDTFWSRDQVDSATLLGVALVLVAVSAFTLRQRADVYPLALAMGTFIFLSIVWFVRVTDSHDEAIFLSLAVYLIVASTVAGRVLMTLLRKWRVAGAT